MIMAVVDPIHYLQNTKMMRFGTISGYIIYPYHILTHVDVQLSAVQMFKSPCPNQKLLDKTTQKMLSKTRSTVAHICLRLSAYQMHIFI